MKKARLNFKELAGDNARIFCRLLFVIAATLATSAIAEKDHPESKLSLKVISFERMPQYPPPPPPPKVFVISAGAGFELAVITLKVTGSAAFDDYKLSAGATLIDAEGNKHLVALSKPLKTGFKPEVWDKQILVFSIKKDVKLATMSVAGKELDLSKIEEIK